MCKIRVRNAKIHFFSLIIFRAIEFRDLFTYFKVEIKCYIQAGEAEHFTKFELNDKITKQRITDFTRKLLDANNIAEIITDYELGKMPDLENIQLQMALIKLTENMMGHTNVFQPVVAEMARNGRFLRCFQ